MDRARSASLRICASRSSGWYLEACNQHDAHHDTHGVAANYTRQHVPVFYAATYAAQNLQDH